MNIKEKEEKSKILNYAGGKFFSEGFYKTSIDQIAKDLNLSKNTIYKHFPNKESIVFDVISEFVKDTRGKVEHELNAETDAIHKFVSMLNVLSQNLSRISDKWMRDIQVHTPHLWDKMDEMRRQVMMKNLTKLIEQGKQEELFEDYPTDLVMTIFIASIRSVVNPDFLLHTKLTKKETIKCTFRLLLSGILTKKGLQIFKKLKLPQ